MRVDGQEPDMRRERWTSGRLVAKSIFIKDAKRRDSATAHGRRLNLPREVCSGEVTWPNGNIEIYIQPNPIIRRMTFSETMDALDNVRKSSVMSSEFFVEAVAYQAVAIEEMERRAFSVEAMHPIARLRVAARYIKTGVVKFPRQGCEQLLTQLLGFGGRRRGGCFGLSHPRFGRRGDCAAGRALRLITKFFKKRGGLFPPLSVLSRDEHCRCGNDYNHRPDIEVDDDLDHHLPLLRCTTACF